jgi:ribosomal protein L44E
MPVDETLWFKCGKCEYKAKETRTLKTHIFTKHPSSKKILWFQCEKCEYKSIHIETLKTHMLTKHVF